MMMIMGVLMHVAMLNPSRKKLQKVLKEKSKEHHHTNRTTIGSRVKKLWHNVDNGHSKKVGSREHQGHFQLLPCQLW